MRREGNISGLPRRAGLSMLEVVLALAVLTGVFAAISQSFMGASRQAREMESRLKEAMLAQMILEQIHDRIRINDYDFQQLVSASGKQTYFGLVVKQKGEGSSPVTTMKVNTFFQYLFNLDGGSLFSAGNMDSLDRKLFLDSAASGSSAASGEAVASANPLRKTDLSLLAQAYQNFVCRITIEDAVVPPPPGGTTQPDFKELLKDITIEIHRLHHQNSTKKGKPPFTLKTKIICPVASVSDACFFKLDDAIYEDEYAKNLAEVKKELRAQPNFGSYDNTTRDMLAKLFLVLQEVNNEAYIIEGALGPALSTGDDAAFKALNDWITDFRGSDLPMFKKELAQAYERRAVLIMRHFRKCRKALYSFKQAHNAFLGQLAKAQKDLTRKDTNEETGEVRTVIKVVSLQASWQTTNPTTQLVCRATALKEFINNEQYQPLFKRLHAYPIRFAGNLALAQEIYQKFIKAGDLLPNDEVVMLKRWVETLKARRLFDYKITNKNADPVSAFQKKYEPSFRSFAQYFEREEIKDADRLKRRNKRYLEEAVKMKALLAPSWWAKILRDYQPNGRVDRFLTTYTKVSGTWGLNRDRILSELRTEIRIVRREMAGMTRDLSLKVDSEIERILREGLSEL